VAEQPAKLMEAFAILAAAAEKFKPKKAGE